MKNYYLSLIALTVLLFTSCKTGPSVDDAIAYNDEIIGNQSDVVESLIGLIENIGDINVSDATLKASLEECISVSKTAKANIEKMDAFDGNTAFRDAGAALMGYYVRILENEYTEMIDILAKEEITEKDLQRLDEIDASMGDDEAKLEQALVDEQEKFADKYGFGLYENELNKEIENLEKKFD